MTGVLRGANIVASTTVALLGAAAVIGAASYGYLDDEGLVDAGFLPALCGAVVFLLALVDLVHQIRRRPELETLAEEVSDSILDSAPATTDRLQTAPELDIFGRDQRARNRQLVLVIAALLAAILLVPLIGLLLSLASLMIFVSIVVEHRRVVSTVIITAVTVAVFHFVFRVFLGVPLPTGLLGVL